MALPYSHQCNITRSKLVNDCQLIKLEFEEGSLASTDSFMKVREIKRTREGCKTQAQATQCAIVP